MALNQFGQTVIKGTVDQKVNPSVYTCQLDKSASADIVPGQLVKLAASVAGSVPVVSASAAATDAHFGVVTYNPMKSTVKAGELLEVAGEGSVIFVEAGAALNRGVKVAWAANAKVVAATTGNVVAGYLLDVASANGDLVRMVVAGPLAPTV